jgi:PhnB protein
MHIEPYPFFKSRCDEAIEFYRSVLGAQITGIKIIMTPSPPM